MKRLLVIGLLLGQALSPGEEAAGLKLPEPLKPYSDAPRAWLGVNVFKPDESITAHLPALPPGIGFVVRSVDEKGPGKAAGLREFDVLWKFGDQMLVNEGQLAALLRLASPGDEVVLAGFRGGKPLEVKLKLGETPIGQHPFPGNLVDSAILQGGCGGPMRVILPAERLASYSTDDGSAKVWMEGEGYQVKILGPTDQVIYEGQLPTDGDLEAIPHEWKRRVHALRRGLDQALAGGIVPVRQPRPRVVPPAGQKP